MKRKERMCWFYADVLLSLLILIAQNERVSSKTCLASMPTLQLVGECPKTKEEWNKRSGIKRCDMLPGTSQCSSFAYHCLLNQNGNVTVEVCAPTWFLSGFCAIYNTEEFRVIDNFSFDCNNNTKIKKEERCPSRYISTETYKYQICYRKREEKNLESDRIHQSNMEEGSSSFVLTIVFIVLFILALIASIFLCVLLYRVGCDKIWKNEQTCENYQNVPMQEDPSLINNQGSAQRVQLKRDGFGYEKEPLLEDPVEMKQDSYSKQEDGSLRKKTTKTNEKAKNDHEEAKEEREKECRRVADNEPVKKGRKIFENNQENQSKELTGNSEVVPGHLKERALNGRRIGRKKAADSNNLGCVGQTVENNSRGFAHGAEEKRYNVSSSEDFNKLVEEEEEEKEAEKEENKQAITNSTSGNNQPHPSPHREGFATDTEERRDNVLKKEDFNKPEEGFATDTEERRDYVPIKDLNKPEEEEEEKEEAEKYENKLAITNSTSENNQPHPSRHREDLTEVNSQK